MRFVQTRGGRAGAACAAATRHTPARQQLCGAVEQRGWQGQRGSWRLASHNSRLEVELAGGAAGPAVDVQAAAAAAAAAGEQELQRYDCLGLAQAMVDLSSAVDDSLLAKLGVEKGSRRLITVEERGAVLAQLEGRESAVSAGGSLSNTLLALARLGDAAAARPGGPAPLHVGMAGLMGSDPLGEFYASQLRAAGVHVAAEPLAGAATGTVVVLTSPDASRTMLSYLGTPAEVAVDAALEAAIARSRLLVLEGYLWELPGAERTIAKAIAAAQRHGCVVAMTAGDAGVVERHHTRMWAAIDQGIDLLFTNAAEAAALLCYEPSGTAQAAGMAAACGSEHCATGEQLALRLGPHCSLVVVTDGDRGSFMAAMGQIHCVPPCWMESAPVDTCGAGDAYAAGLLYGYLQGYDLPSMGRTAARVASAVISKIGAQLTPEAAAGLAEGLPAPVAQQRSSTAAALAPSTPRAA